MSKYVNVVKVKVKPSLRSKYIKLVKARPKFKGQTSALFVETARSQFHMIGIWKSKSDMIKARPKMIEFLDKARHTLEELSSELGVTDPHSGTVIVEK